jgi:RHS repeat-associated protein
VHEGASINKTPYLFTSKEFDQETGLYYFGARYYDPRTSVWQSADPILGKYLPDDNAKRSQLIGMGGIYNDFNLDPYGYSHQNPLKFVDPDGNFTNPVENAVLRSHVSGRHNPMGSSFGMVRNNGKRPHQGVDLRAITGTNTYAVGSGRVVGIDREGNGDYGKNVTYEFKYNYSIANFLSDLVTGNWDGMGEKINNSGKTFYARHAHLNTISDNVQLGSRLKEGQLLGTTGSTGNARNLPEGERHLHFEIRDSNPVGRGLNGREDPAHFLQGLNSNPKDNRSSNPDEWK